MKEVYQRRENKEKMGGNRAAEIYEEKTTSEWFKGNITMILDETGMTTEKVKEIVTNEKD